MQRHRVLRSLDIVRVDRRHDRLVLAHPALHVGLALQRHVADPVHMRLHVGNGDPGDAHARPGGDGDVERFVVLAEGGVIELAGRFFLLEHQAGDALALPGVEALRRLGHDGDLHRLPHEQGLGHLPCGDAGHHCAAMRANLDESGICESDQCLAHRLARYSQPCGDVLFGKA